MPDDRDVGRYEWERALLADPDVASTQLLVLLVLGTYVNRKTGRARPSQRTLAEATGLDERTVRRHLTAAVAGGYLALIKRGRFGQASEYRVALPDAFVRMHPDAHVRMQADLGDRKDAYPHRRDDGAHEDTHADADADTHADTGVRPTGDRQQQDTPCASHTGGGAAAQPPREDSRRRPEGSFVTVSTSSLIDEWLDACGEDSRPSPERIDAMRHCVEKLLADELLPVKDVRSALLEDNDEELRAEQLEPEDVEGLAFYYSCLSDPQTAQ